MAGVALPEEQVSLLTDSQHRPLQALTISWVQDPMADPRFPTPCRSLSEDGVWGHWVLPGIVDLRPQWWQEPQQHGESDWRYPSVLGRQYRSDWLGGHDLGALEAYRLWHLWPLEPWDVEVVLEVEAELIESAVVPVRRWCAAALHGDIDACEMYSYEMDAPVQTHTHLGDAEFYLCEEAESYLDSMSGDYFARDENGQPVALPLPEPDLPDDLAQVWYALLDSSQRVTHQLHNALPAWEQRKVLRTERHYSPWLS